MGDLILFSQILKLLAGVGCVCVGCEHVWLNDDHGAFRTIKEM